MSSYEQCLAVEQDSTDSIVEFLERRGANVTPHTGRDEQKRGDLTLTNKHGRTYTLEIKAERKWTGNLFVETWSNREWGRTGWLFQSKADLICFHFLDSQSLVCVSLPALRSYLLAPQQNRLSRLPERMVWNGNRNDTHGRLVRVSQLEAAALKHFVFHQDITQVKDSNATHN